VTGLRPRRAAIPVPSPASCEVNCAACGRIAHDLRDPKEARIVGATHCATVGHVTAVTFSQVILYAPDDREPA
jgi:hypothetical protein